MKELNDFLRDKKSLHTKRAYQSTIERFLTFFNIEKCEDIEKITGNQYREYRNALRDSGLSESSCNSHFRNILSFVTWLNTFEFIDNLTSIKKVKPYDLGKNSIKSLSQEEATAMINAPKQRDEQLMLLMMFQLGLRRGEVTKILVKDIYNGNILIRGKKDNNVEMHLPGKIEQEIRNYLATRAVKSDYLFPGNKGKKLSEEAVNLRVKSAAKKIGIDGERLEQITAHITRKTCGSLLVNKNVGLDVVQKVLRHANITTTRKYYARTADKRIADAIESLEY